MVLRWNIRLRRKASNLCFVQGVPYSLERNDRCFGSGTARTLSIEMSVRYDIVVYIFPFSSLIIMG